MDLNTDVMEKSSFSLYTPVNSLQTPKYCLDGEKYGKDGAGVE
jgi:hypothetical protein